MSVSEYIWQLAVSETHKQLTSYLDIVDNYIQKQIKETSCNHNSYFSCIAIVHQSMKLLGKMAISIYILQFI